MEESIEDHTEEETVHSCLKFPVPIPSSWTFLKPLFQEMSNVSTDTIGKQIEEFLSEEILKAEGVNMTQLFCEKLFIFAHRHLTNKNLLVLLEVVPKLKSINNGGVEWHSLARGALIAYNNLVGSGVTPDDLDGYFKKLLHPCTMGYFSDDSRPESKLDSLHELRYLDILKLYVEMRSIHGNFSWQQVLEWWTAIFYNCSNPILLVGYADLVKNRGSASEALNANEFALSQLSFIDDDGASFEVMRCRLKLLKERLDISYTMQNPKLQYEAAVEFQSRLNSFVMKYKSGFADLLPGSSINGFYPMLEHRSEEKEWKPHAGGDSIDCSLDKLKSLRMTTSNSEQSETETKGKVKVFRSHRPDENEDIKSKVFGSNLHYDVKEEDLRDMLKEKNVFPETIRILKNQEGESRGLVHLIFKSKESAEQAIKSCHKMDVFGRSLFLAPFTHDFSRHQETAKRPPSKPSPEKNAKPQPKATVLIVKNVDEEFKRNLKSVENTIAQYGHVKDIEILEDPQEFTVRIEFYMPEDTMLVHQKIMEDKILGENTISRIGFPKSKKNEEIKIPKKAAKKNRSGVSGSVGPSNTETDSFSGELSTIGPQIPPGIPKTNLTRPKKREFVPRQALSRSNQPIASKKHHMKSRLDVSRIAGVTSKEQGSSMSVDVNSEISESEKNFLSSESPSNKRAKMDDSNVPEHQHSESMDELELVMETASDEDERTPLSNDDFRKMFLKK